MLVYVASLLLVGGGGIWARLALKGYGPVTILRFNAEQGIVRVGDPGELIWLAGAGAVIVIINAVLGLELAERDRFLSRLLAAGTAVFAVLLFIGFAAIIGAN